jgi:hypothetical protein
MDTLAMHRRLTGAGFEDRQAEAIIDAITGGVATKQDLDLLRTELKGEMALLGARVDKLDQKMTLTLWGLGIAILAPAVTKLVLG